MRPLPVSVGLGLRSGASVDAIVALVKLGLAQAAALLPCEGLSAQLWTVDSKRGEAGLAQAAQCLALPLGFLPRAALQAADPAGTTRSRLSQMHYGVGSVAEAAALAGAGAGARLLVARLAAGGVTCAIAIAAPPTGTFQV